MAAAKLPFQIALEQNTNDDSTAFGKWFGRTYSTSDTLSLRGLIERVAFDQSVYSRDIIEGVIDRLTTVMTELLTSGESVKWDPRHVHALRGIDGYERCGVVRRECQREGHPHPLHPREHQGRAADLPQVP